MKVSKKHIIVIVAIGLVLGYIYYALTRKHKDESSFDDTTEPIEPAVLHPLPLWYNIKYEIESKGKSGVFPMVLTKITDGVIELPFRLSLQKQDYPYKYIDVNTGDKITIVDVIDMSYVTEGKSFFDNFLVTDKGYIIAYSQANAHFGVN